MTINVLRCPIRVLALAASSLVLSTHGALAQATPIQLTAGESTTLVLDGNPSTGYTWALDGAVPKDVVTVDVLGYASPELKPGERPKLGAPQKFQVIVTGVNAGHADLVFRYVKAGTPQPARTQGFAIEVLEAAGDAAQKPGPEPTPDPTADRPEDTRNDMFADPDSEEDGGGTGQ